MLVKSSQGITETRSRTEVKRQLRARAKALKQAGVTQVQIARLGGVSISMVSHYLAGRTRSAKLDQLTTLLLEQARGPRDGAA